MRLGYPSYIIPALGLGKVLAILAILWPGFPRLKEWAYAGILFNMIGATVSHVACNDGGWIIIVTVTIAAITLASWALRPQNRRLGDHLKRTEVARQWRQQLTSQRSPAALPGTGMSSCSS